MSLIIFGIHPYLSNCLIAASTSGQPVLPYFHICNP